MGSDITDSIVWRPLSGISLYADELIMRGCATCHSRPSFMNFERSIQVWLSTTFQRNHEILSLYFTQRIPLKCSCILLLKRTRRKSLVDACSCNFPRKVLIHQNWFSTFWSIFTWKQSALRKLHYARNGLIKLQAPDHFMIEFFFFFLQLYLYNATVYKYNRHVLHILWRKMALKIDVESTTL